MSWYAWLLLGVVIGLIISRYLPARLVIQGKIKQRGRNTTNTISDIKTSIKQPKKRKLFGRRRNRSRTKKKKDV